MIINVVRVNFAGDWWLSFERLFWDPAVFAVHNERSPFKGEMRKEKKKKAEGCRGAATKVEKPRCGITNSFRLARIPLFTHARGGEGGSAFRITRLRKYFLNNFALTSMRRRSGIVNRGEKKERKKRGGWTFMEYFAPSPSTSYVNLMKEGNWECERITWK